jgi:hypothetical protein
MTLQEMINLYNENLSEYRLTFGINKTTLKKISNGKIVSECDGIYQFWAYGKQSEKKR